MEQFVKNIFSFVFRVMAMLAGLVFVASLLGAGLLFLGVWLLRALWARLTGQPVSPWTFKVNRQAVWGRFYSGPSQGRSAERDTSDVIDAEVKEISDVKEK